MKLMTPPGYSHKLALNLGSGWGSAVLYLAPATEAFKVDGAYLPEYAGKTMCPGASPECFANCLIHSGQMIMPHAKTARVRRTRLLINDPATFAQLLHKDIDSHLRWCERSGMLPSFRFNGTSDYPFEEFVLPHLGLTAHQYLLDKAPGAMVNEYTKRYGVMKRWLEGAYPSNLYMTFSLHERNGIQARDILRRGGNVAVVFRSELHRLPSEWDGRPVFDGDGDDLRWMDNARARRQGIDPSAGLWIGLAAKGRLARTASPFAIDPTIGTGSIAMLPVAA